MRTINKEELNKILEDHNLWLEDNSKGSRADLSYADLSHANLYNADLIYANLRYADLSHTNLRYANLSHTNLRYANLRYADLSHTNLTNAYLYNANLFNTIGNSKEIKTIQTSKYIINYTKDRIQIGCENHSYVEWFSMSDEDIEALDEGALDWWHNHKGLIKLAISIKD